MQAGKGEAGSKRKDYAPPSCDADTALVHFESLVLIKHLERRARTDLRTSSFAAGMESLSPLCVRCLGGQTIELAPLEWEWDQCGCCVSDVLEDRQ